MATDTAGAPEAPRAAPGRVALVGAGPGDPDLLTLGALRRIREADLVLYDRLVGPRILALVPESTKRIDVGKRRGYSHSQHFTTARMIAAAQAGQFVVRLKGGDALLFSRLAEELQALRTAGIDYEILPGVTAASAAAARLGVPLTQRGVARGCLLASAATDAAIDWQQAAYPDQTLAVYMGRSAATRLVRDLLAGGLPPDTPAAAASAVGWPQEQTLTGTLATLPAALATQGAADDAHPWLLLVGRVLETEASCAAPACAPGTGS